MGAHSLQVLKGINLDIYKNEFVALMGPSGSGKSTLMNILGCLDSPTSGTYILNGHDVSTMPDAQLAQIRNKEIGFVFQQFNLLPRLTAVDNVALPLVYAGINKKLRTQMAKEVLAKVGLAERSHHKPNEMSGGQIQRVAVARALLNERTHHNPKKVGGGKKKGGPVPRPLKTDPAIILADEPTGNLDTKTSREIMELFVQIHQAGNTVIIVTHEEDIAAYARRVIRLRDGVVESDLPREQMNLAAAH